MVVQAGIPHGERCLALFPSRARKASWPVAIGAKALPSNQNRVMASLPLVSKAYVQGLILATSGAM